MPDSQALGTLVVDDSPDDCFFIEKAILAVPSLHLVGVVHDGAEAVCYLAGLGDYENRVEHPYPEVLLLDLKMPAKNGFEVLEWLKKQTRRPKLVIVQSGSLEVADQERSVALGRMFSGLNHQHSTAGSG